MQRKKVSSWKILVVVAAANLLATAAQALPDAPHDAGNGIGCLTCHQMTSTYPKLLPPNGGTPLTVEDSYANRICISCHDGSQSTLIVDKTHSAAAIGSGKYGAWTVECWVCHNEHKQEQAVYGNTTGYIRRSINLANIKKPDGTTFGKTGSKSVIFTGPATLADGDATYNGICEVCHTQTTYHRNTAAGNHTHNAGDNCVSCHNHDSGFTGGTVHNTLIADDEKTGDSSVACSDCHTNYATSPETAHSACNACHTTAPDLEDSTFPTVAGPPPQADWDGAIGTMLDNLTAAGYSINGATGRLNDPDGTDIAGVGGDNLFEPIKCGVCHAAKPDALQAGTHGGHTTNDFAWDATTQTSCGTAGCHDYVTNNDVVGEIHGGACTICHDNPQGGDGTAIAGSATNGVDGSAALAGTASPHADNCLVCHPAATYDLSTVHHDSKSGYAGDGNCTQCHAGSNYPGNHAARVSLAGNCLDCHNGTQGTTGGIPVDPADPKIHDACLTCHNTDGDATLKAPYGKAQAMPNGGAGSNNGGGTCEECHTSGFGGYHGAVNHESMVSLYANCNTCHEGTQAPAGGPVPLDGGNNKKHDACTVCHGTNGRLIGSAADKTGGDVGGTNGGGNCSVCHGEYMYNHTTINHATTVALDGNCDDCHTGTEGNATTVPADPANNKKHDACSTCHSLSGALTGSASGKDNATFGGTDGGGNCSTCHGAFAANHAASVPHTTMVASYVNCSSCHTATGNTLDPADPKVHDACLSCHDVDGTLTGSATGKDNSTVGGTDGGGPCDVCHGEYFTLHANINHAGNVIVNTGSASNTVNCIGCHTTATPGSGPFTTSVHTPSGCETCHTAGTGALKGSAAAGNIDGIAADAAYECGECHAGHFSTHTHVHTVSLGAGDVSQENGTACASCHNDNGGALATWNDIYVEHLSSCATCHNAARDTSKSGTYSIGETIQTVIAANANPTNCSACHRDKIDSISADSTHGSIDHVALGKVTGVAQCTGCHDQGGAGTNDYFINTIHKGACGACHVAPAGGGPLHDYSGGGSTLGDNINYEAINGGAGGSCVACHTPYGTDFQNAHNTVDHKTEALADALTASANCTTTCHDGASSATIVTNTHGGTCTACHTNTTTDGRLRAGANGSATGHAIDSSSTCADCHADYDTDYSTAHDVVDHSGIAATANCTTTCHDGTSAANIITVTHIDLCINCHTNVATDGTLASRAYGDASNGAGNCTFCHAAYGTDFQSHAYTDHKTKASADVLTATASCTSNCHDASSLATVLNTVHKANCGNCHTDIATDGTLKNGTNGNAAGHTIDSQSACADCHAAYATNFETAHDVKDHTGMTALATCTANCHDGASAASIIATTHKGTCTSCHTNMTTDGRLKTGTNGDATGGASDCAACHGTPFNYDSQFETAHDVKDHTGIAGAATCTSSCHDGSSAASIITTTHKETCTSCHTNTTTDGQLKAGTNGDATGGSGVCTSCHSAYNTSFETAHQNENHAEVTATTNATPTLNCAGCHSGDLIGGALNHGLSSSCENCHANRTTDGTFTSGPLGDATAHVVGTPSACADCHAANYFDSHTHGTGSNHDVLLRGTDLSNSQPCNNCHGNFTNDWAGISALHTLGCGQCHNSTRNTNVSGYADIQDVIATGTTVGCLNCHSDRAAAHMDHLTYGTGAVTGTGSASCLGCHDAGGLANNTQYVEVIHNLNGGGCGTCHVSATGGGPLRDYSGSGGSIGEFVNYETLNGGAGGSCIACHTAYNSDFFAGHKNETHANVTGTATCQTCHANPAIITSVHANNCNDCHNADGVLNNGTHAASKDGATSRGTATAHVIGAASTCADCHASINTAYTNHAVQDHSGVGGTASCQTCHTGADIIADEHANTCSLCHTSVTGVLKSGAVGDASGHTVGTTSTCANCHASRAADYVNHSVKDHKTTGLADSLLTASVCDGCHAEATAAAIVGTTHNNSCATCHTAVTGVLRSGTNGDATAHAINTQSTCATCHNAYSTDFYTGHKNEDHALVQATTNATPVLNCGHCHTGDLISGTPNHLGNCGNCHTSAANGEFRSGPLGNATGHVIGSASKCVDCHSSFVFSSHSHTHTVVFDTTNPTPNDWSQETQTPCSSCHNDGGALLTTFASIKTEHLDSCATCHNATRDTSESGTNSVGATVQNVIDANGNPTNCRDCHRDKQDEFSGDATHGTIDHVSSGKVVNTGATWCTDCHDRGSVGTNDYYINTIHKVGSGNTCGVCHQSQAGAGPLREPWETSNPAGGSCTDCHGSNFLTLHGPSIQHVLMLPNDSTSAITGGRECYKCHDQNLDYSIQKWVHNSKCDSCHDTFGALINSAAGHDNGTPGGTDGGGGCRTCHAAPGVDKASHHAVAEAQKGMCQFCHFPDRTKVDRTNKMPKQLECDLCHIVSNTSTFKVNRATYTSDMETSATWANPSNNPGMVFTEVPSHTIAAAGAAITVYDYEACFSCHTDAQVDGAPEVLPYHGRPGGYLAGTSHLATDPNIPWEEPMSKNSITSMKYHILWKAPGRTTTGKTMLDIMARPSTLGVVDINGNPFPDWWGGRQYAKGGTAQTWTKNNYDEALSKTIKPTMSTIPWDRFNTAALKNIKIPKRTDLPFPMTETVYIVRATHDGQLASNQLVVWAKNLDPDATLTVNYNGSTYPMTKLPGEQNKFAATITDGTYVSTVRVFSSNVSASSDVTAAVENLAPPASIDYVTITKADWAGGSLTVWATHTNNDGVNSFKASYNGVTNRVMTWNAGLSRYEVTFAVAYAGGDVLVDSNDPNTGSNTKPVINLDAAADTITFTKADWDTPFNGQLTVWFTHANNDGIKTYQCDYNGSNGNIAAWSAGNGRYELVLTSTGRPYPGGNVRCYSYNVGGDDRTTAVTNVSAPLDTLTVTKADWDNRSNGTLYVWATHSDNNGVKTYQVDYNGSNGNAMTWNAAAFRYEAEIPVVGTPFPAGQALVYSNNSGGDRVLATVDSIATTTPDHVNTGHVTWPAGGIYCINCHSPLGLQDVIDDIHMGNCLECHSGFPGTQGNYKVGQAIPNNSFGTTFPAGGGDCDSCHETFTSNPTWYINDVDGSCATTDCYTAGEDTWEDKAGGTAGQYDSGIDTQISDGGNGWTTANGTVGAQAGRTKTWHHHKSTNAQKGNCTHCHNNGKQWTQVPKQAPCAYCHINGASSNFNLQTFNFDVATQYNTVITSVASNTHDITDILADGVKIRPYDFGVCFDCHDGSDIQGGVQAQKVRPYHASGIGLDVSKAGAQGGIPLNLATGYQEPQNLVDAKKGIYAVQFNNTSPWEPTPGDRSNDLIWAYKYHPGRGGIINSSSTIANGSFNLLYPLLNKRTQYYKTGNSFNGENRQNVYNKAPYSTQWEVPKATPYVDGNGDTWNFNQSQTINYLELFNRSATRVSVKVPVFPDKPLPSVPDKISITRADHNPVTNKLRVWAKTTLSTDWYLKNQTAGAVTVTYNASTYNMIWNNTDSRWEYTATVADPGSVQVTSTMGAGASASRNTEPAP